MAGAGCLIAFDKQGGGMGTITQLDSSYIGSTYMYLIPNWCNREPEYICYTDQNGACCRLDMENELCIQQIQGRICNATICQHLQTGISFGRSEIYGCNWACDVVRYKAGSSPTSPTDGNAGTITTTQNVYCSTCLNVDGLTNDTTYYFKIFSIDNNGLVINTAERCLTTNFFHPVCYGYTGSEQTWTVPFTGTYRIQVWGAAGGDYGSCCGGYGGYASGFVCLYAGCVLRIYVGGKPASQTAMNTTTNGGYNGGGNATTTCYSGTTTYAQAGGGGTDVRYNGNTLYHRFIVAGGGAGTTNWYNFAPTSTNRGGGGTYGCGTLCGTQTAAGANGSFGQGAHGCNSTNYRYHAGGGGGGWYGGGTDLTHSDSVNCSACASGGSGYTYTSSTCGNHPNKSCLGNLCLMTNACCYAPGTNFPSPSGGTENGHQGCGCVKISLS